MVEKQRLYKVKQSAYFQGSRPDVVGLIPDGSNCVLELGCGEGKTLLSARDQGKASEIVGIDIIPSVATHDLLDAYLQGDLDTLVIPYSDNYFDVVICADVLEHLLDPWSLMKRLVSVLKPGGLLIASIPNARDYLFFIAIYMRGSFAYKQEGLFDRGHIRFFCKQDMMELLEGSGLSVIKFDFTLEKVRKFAWIVSAGLLEQFLVKQYRIVARKPITG